MCIAITLRCLALADGAKAGEAVGIPVNVWNERRLVGQSSIRMGSGSGEAREAKQSKAKPEQEDGEQPRGYNRSREEDIVDVCARRGGERRLTCGGWSDKVVRGDDE
ncbi:hypothetical protein OF83DRAFT_1109385 [Amylostereum chailletii]|nr:hypothetical protein OF83DRAFT_1109385 [Amylostereum chailletii]